MPFLNVCDQLLHPAAQNATQVLAILSGVFNLVVSGWGCCHCIEPRQLYEFQLVLAVAAGVEFLGWHVSTVVECDG
jgi:hypothetical protein